MAKLAFASATIIPKGPNVQIRVVVTEYEGNTRLDIREYKLFGEKKEYKPTPNGVAIPQSMYPAVMAAMTKHGAELPRRVVDIDKSDSWVIGKTAADAVFRKTHVYTSEEEALGKEPPDGYRIFRVKIKKGAVVSEVKTHFRDGGVWKRVKAKTVAAPTKAPKAKSVAAKKVRR